MKYLISLLFIINIGLHGVAQNITSQRYVAPLKTTVVMRNLKPSNTINQDTLTTKYKSFNEEEFEIEAKKKNKPKSFKTPFPVTTVSTNINALQNQKLNAPDAPVIFESPCVDFHGLNQFYAIPPDVGGAVGFDDIFMVLNDSFKIQDKYGDSLYQQREQDPNGFWSALGATNLFDPKIIYDPYRHRWIFIILKDGATGTPQNSALLISISQTPDPLGNWFQWQIDADAENDQWFDYPSVGFNRNWLVINGNMLPVSGSGSAITRTFAFNIDNLYAGSLSAYSAFTTTDYSNICPALTYDPNMNDIWCVTNDDIDDNDLRFFKISGSASNPSMTEEGYISLGSDWGLGNRDIGPQQGSSARINTGDHRVLSVIWRNGILYSAQTIFLPDEQDPPDYSTIQFVSADPGTETVHEAINFAANNNSMYAFPCLAVNNKGDIIISCSKFTFSSFPSAVVIVRRNDGSGSFVQTTFKSGEDWYINYDNSSTPRNRWGDYTTAMVDPSDDNSVWVASEYSRPKTVGNAGQWGTWWAKICSGICMPTVNFTDILNNGDMVKYEASDIVFGLGVVGAGADVKLDAGNKIVLQPPFRANQGSRVRTYIEGCGGPQ